MALHKHWLKYPPLHIAFAIVNGFDQGVKSTELEDQLFAGDAMPLNHLPADVQRFIAENR